MIKVSWNNGNSQGIVVGYVHDVYNTFAIVLYHKELVKRGIHELTFVGWAE